MLLVRTHLWHCKELFSFIVVNVYVSVAGKSRGALNCLSLFGLPTPIVIPTLVENGSKNNNETNPKQANKVVPIHAMSTRPRCFVYLLNQYFKRLPPKALELDIFYIRPKTKYEEGMIVFLWGRKS